MADDDASQKTEEPTPKRLDDARSKGDVASSREVSSWFMLLGALVVVALMAPRLALSIQGQLTLFFARAHDIPVNIETIPVIVAHMGLTMGRILVMPAIVVVVAAILSGIVQHGLLFSPERLKPDLAKLSPIKGLQRLFSLKSVTELIKGVLKISVVGAIALVLVLPIMQRLTLVPSTEIGDSLVLIHRLIVRILGGVVAVLTAIALLDLAYQRFEHTKKLRMSRSEVKDEMRQSEGDPHVKARLRAIRMERARQRMMQAVPEASVVITNPTHFAIALKYDAETMPAPLVVAKGVDAVALRIRETATAHDVPVVENPPLARALYDSVELDREIPTEHYKAVAEIIAFVLGIGGKRMPAGATSPGISHGSPPDG